MYSDCKKKGKKKSHVWKNHSSKYLKTTRLVKNSREYLTQTSTIENLIKVDKYISRVAVREHTSDEVGK